MNWLRELRDANSIDELLAIVNDYLVHQPEENWSWIPPNLRPPPVTSVADLDHWHQRLTIDLDSAALPNIRVQDLAVFFVRAWARALELGENAAPGAPSNDREYPLEARRPDRKRK